MPNWCDNRVELSHSDVAMIDRAEKAFKEGKFLEEFVPVPKELYDTVAGSVAGEYAKELHEAQQKLNIKYFGSANWYDYCLKHWSTKWDVGGEEACIERAGDTLFLNFDSAWSPPTAAYAKLEALGFAVEAFYYEPGCDFCGHYCGGIDTDYPATGDIPKEIDEAFAISENRG